MRPGKAERAAIKLERAIKALSHGGRKQRALAVPDDGSRMFNACNLMVSRVAANAPFARPLSTFDGTMRVKRPSAKRWGTK